MERREKGAGSIFQMANGKWRAQIDISSRAGGGKRKSKYFSGNTRAEVKRKMDSWVEESKKFSSENIRNITVATYITTWLDVYKRFELKPSSFQRLASSVNTHVIPNIGHITLGNLRTKDVQMMINAMAESPYNSKSNIKKAYDAIRACINDGIARGELMFNPCMAAKLPSVEHVKPVKEITVYTAEEKTKIINECRRCYKNGRRVYSYGDMYILILNTGMRLGEALALQQEDVNLEDGTVYVCKNLTRVRTPKGRVEKSTLKLQNSPKTSKSVREIPLNESAKAAIRDIYVQYPREESGFLVRSDSGSPITPENFLQTFYTILDRCDIRRDGVHSLRHTFASDLYSKKVDIKTISELLGHSSIAVTANTYIKVFKTQKAESVQLLDEA